MRRTVIVFIHGLFSSGATWDKLIEQLGHISDIKSRCDMERFTYPTSRISWNPLRRTPDFDTLAENLRSLVTELSEKHERIVLVTHSQGGLIAQRFLSRVISDGRARELAKIRRIVMFARPNSGSELMLLMRRVLIPFTRNTQERELRPLHISVVDAQRRILTGVVQATELSDNKCPIPIVSCAGDSDNVVIPASALSIFPHGAVLPGDHFSVIKPKADGRLVSALHREILRALAEHHRVLPPPVTPADRRHSFPLRPEQRRELRHVRRSRGLHGLPGPVAPGPAPTGAAHRTCTRPRGRVAVRP